MDADGVIRLRRVILGLARRLNAPSVQEGLSPAQASVLALIINRGPLGLRELSELGGIDPTMLSRVVGKLETFGLVRRQRDPHDYRAVRVEGTSAGEATWRLIAAEQTELISELLACLSDRERCALAAAMPALEQLSESLRHPPRHRFSAGGRVT